MEFLKVMHDTKNPIISISINHPLNLDLDLGIYYAINSIIYVLTINKACYDLYRSPMINLLQVHPTLPLIKHSFSSAINKYLLSRY